MFSILGAKPQESASGDTLFCAALSAAVRRAKAWLDARILQGKKGVFSEVIDLTPELAELLLARNSENRVLKEGNLQAIRQDILEGRWELNGEPIIVSDTGELNDGQHRCHAVKETGRAIRTVIIFGVARDTRSTTDTGMAKTPGDHLAMKGIASSNQVAAIAGYLWQVERFGELPLNPHAPGYRPTKAQVQDIAERRLGDIRRSLESVTPRGSAKIASLSQLVLAHVLLCDAGVKSEAATTFINRLIDGAEMKNNDPILVARERLIEEKRKRTTSPRKTIEVILRAWNMHRRGVTTVKIQLMDNWPKVSR